MHEQEPTSFYIKECPACGQNWDVVAFEAHQPLVTGECELWAM
jgi:hypothetical protein